MFVKLCVTGLKWAELNYKKVMSVHRSGFCNVLESTFDDSWGVVVNIPTPLSIKAHPQSSDEADKLSL